MNPVKINARGAIRTHEFLRKWVLSPSPLTWLGNPRTDVVFALWQNKRRDNLKLFEKG